MIGNLIFLTKIDIKRTFEITDIYFLCNNIHNFLYYV